MPIVVARGLSKTYRVAEKQPGLRGSFRHLFNRKYKTVRAVDDVSFTIEPGEMVAFLGPNGAGKTTTLKMLSGLIYPSSGSCEALGFTPSDRVDAFRRRFSLVMGQKNQLWWDLPASDSFRLHQEIYNLPADEFQRTLGELTELFRVEKLAKQPVRELSLGERMRMELIASLLHRPELLLLDEPTIGLDVVGQGIIQSCLRDYNATRGTTMLLTSHYMRDVEALCRRVLVINHGKLVFDGPLEGITDRFGQLKLLKLQFVGPAPELDAFGKVTQREGRTATLEIDRGKASGILADLLARFPVADLSVEDPPLEDAIARIFEQSAPAPAEDVAA